MPIGAPGWPELACCTASMARARMALAISEVSSVEMAAMCGEPDSAGQGVDRRGEPVDFRATPWLRPAMPTVPQHQCTPCASIDRRCARPTLAAHESPDPRRRPRRTHAAADRHHAQAAAAGARQAADRMAPARRWRAPACARWSSTPPGWKSSFRPRWATARAGGCDPLFHRRPRPRRRAGDRRRHRQGAALAGAAGRRGLLGGVGRHLHARLRVRRSAWPSIFPAAPTWACCGW